MNNRGRVIRQLKEVPPQAGRDIYLTLDLKLQQYIETLLAGSRAAVVVTDRVPAPFWRWYLRQAMTQTCSSTASPVKITPSASTIRTRRWSTARRRGSTRRRQR
ncbi:penicillin-binding protein 2 (PBP-2) [Klebsiella variicola]|uniref:Penicillin-binding protein 2 (PBP-2) n=1 Tax=Klebsiella variicola TaxID=244366 RepID=A0A7H4MFN7_KLEVA|nr:penicillin-binding protein 2 (PBP-2) [Klebsiella variicola]